MEELKELIRKNNKEIYQNTIRVENFLNQSISTKVIKEISENFYSYFKDKKIDKVVSIETGGVLSAIFLADKLGVDALILHKEVPYFESEIYKAETVSFTKKKKYTLNCSIDNLKNGERVLFIDDFLANGQDLIGAVEIFNQAGAELVGVGIVIEKSHQHGREILDKMNVDNFSLLKVSGFEDNQIIWGN